MPSTKSGHPEIFRFTVSPRQPKDPRSLGYLADAHALGITSLTRLVCNDLYFIEGSLQAYQAEKLASSLLSNNITQAVTWQRVGEEATGKPPGGQSRDEKVVVEVALRPGVTDPVAEEIVRSARVMGIAQVQRASTGLRFELYGAMTARDVDLLTHRLLANSVIHRSEVGEIQPIFPVDAKASTKIEWFPIRDMSDEALIDLSRSRRAALDLAEMQAIQAYFCKVGRDMTDVELECLAQTWSEHCVHKTFKAIISISNYENLPIQLQAAYPGGTVDNIMKSFLKSATDTICAPWVRSAFVDNAGIIEYDGFNEISFKVETHNHPSAIEPFGGANTGVGGVIRDVLGVSAKPIAATDVLCFGPQTVSIDDLPEGVLHPRRVQAGVVAGVQDYGNKIGIPTVSGAILYDEGYTANPLVYCGCVGIAPKDAHPRTPQAGDHVIVIGGKTGRDGLRGATFSSMTMDAQTGEVAGASVQIGDPITEKGLVEVVLRARDANLYHAITDCGAGGLSSAVGEMAGVIGAEVDLQHVRLKYSGLAPWEIWLSEAQERMVLAVPQSNLTNLANICKTFDVDLTDIGTFQPTGRLVVRYGDQILLNLENDFLHHGIPQRRLQAIIPREQGRSQPVTMSSSLDPAQALLRLLGHPNIASKEAVIRIYDHEVQGGTLLKPLVGVAGDAPGDAVVLKPVGTRGQVALALSAGINAEYGKVDTYRMAASVIDEAVRNAVAVGANPDRIAILDNFCWGDPLRAEVLGDLLEAARGCYDTSLLHRVPFISGKDSFNNEYLGKDGARHSIPPTLLISAIGLLDDISQAVSMDLKTPGAVLYLVGSFKPDWGGSHFHLVSGSSGGGVPVVDTINPQIYRRLFQAIQNGWVNACHDLSEGGLAVAAAEMCIGGRLGLDLRLEANQGLLGLFGETNGCLLVEVPENLTKVFENIFEGLPIARLGIVISEPCLRIESGNLLINLPMEDLLVAWKGNSRVSISSNLQGEKG
ncbi:MAG TPA: phosphoribosylformylglycinamidine synthase subunit PurL [Anaerolineaceae bacterium]